MKIFNWLLSFFKDFSKKSPLNGIVGSIGTFLNNKDDRDIKWASFVQARKPTDKFITDLSMIAVENQLDKGTCVGQAEGTAVKFYFYKILGVVINISRRFIYVASKTKDANPNQGTSPRVAGLVITKYFGAATTDTVPDNNLLPYDQYLNVKFTGAVLDDANKNKLPGVAFIDAEENQVCQAIEDHGTITGTLAVDLSKWYLALIAKLFKIDGYHRITLYGHELIAGRRKIYFRNSWGNWGNGGNGEFWFDEYVNYLYDIQVYTEIPKDLLEKARGAEYTFNTNLSIGDSGVEVYKLQQRLQKEGYLKGVDIANLEPYYGSLTASAVLHYQLDHAVDEPEVLKKLAGNYVGSKTRNTLNNTIPKKSLIILWAQAIQAFEGWAIGSISYRNNNPGNLRYSPLEIGKNGGFSVFADYTTGFKALTDLLTNAATGKSTVYSPDMTLLDFYNHYAPSSDNNSPTNYANFVAQKIGVPVTTQIKNLV